MASVTFTMHRMSLLLAYLSCLAPARRVRVTDEQLETSLTSGGLAQQENMDVVLRPQSLVEATQFDAWPGKGKGQESKHKQDASIVEDSAKVAGWIERLWVSPNVQRVLAWLCISSIGFALRGRFTSKQVGAIQKLLTQFLVGAAIFKSVSQEKIELKHAGDLGSGVLLILTRALSGALVAYAAVGGSYHPERAKLRRTAVILLSTTAVASSVLPFVGEFIGPEFVGLVGIIDLPNVFYTSIGVPVVLKALSEKTVAPVNPEQGGHLLSAVLQCVKDPMTLSLILGVITSVVTEGQGLNGLGFARNAIDTLAGAQIPILFLLIGLKLNIGSSTPIICVVLLLANQGLLLVMVSVFSLALNPGEEMSKIIITFLQGAPSVVGLAIMMAAFHSGLQGYSPDFAFDFVGMAFPIASTFQCVSGVAGALYRDHVGIIGLLLIVIAGIMRVVFNRYFQEDSLVQLKVPQSPTGS